MVQWILETKRREWIKLGILALSSIITLGVSLFLVDPRNAQILISKAGYWVMLVTFVTFIYLLVKAFKRARHPRHLKGHIPGVIIIIIAGIFVQLHHPRMFKIANDEYVLAVVAKHMHEQRTVYVQARAHFLNGDVQWMNGFVDKRPYFFPFIISILHDVFGYEPSMPIYFNAGAIFVLFALVYIVGYLATRAPPRGDENDSEYDPNAGRFACFGVILLSTLPLLGMNATGGMFEILNVIMILAFVLAAIHYLKSEGTHGLGLLIVTCILLAQTRYESILFCVALAAIVAIKWFRQREVALTWFSALTPLLLFPPLLVNVIFQSNRGFWQLADDVEKNVFGTEYFYDNIGHAVTFLFFSGDGANSVLLSIAGVFSILLFGLNLLRKLKTKAPLSDVELAIVPILVIVVTLIGVLMFYYWGQLSDPQVSRISLPLHVFFTVCTCIVIAGLMNGRRLPVHAHILLAIFSFATVLPVAVRSSIMEKRDSAIENAWFMDFLEDNANRQSLVIANSSIPAIIHGWAATPIFMANIKLPQLKATYESGYYDEIYVLTRWKLDPESLKETSLEAEKLTEAVHLEHLAELRLSPNTISRISRISAVDTPSPEALAELRERHASILDEVGVARDPESLNPAGYESDQELIVDIVRMLP